MTLEDKIFDATERLSKGKFIDIEAGKEYTLHEVYFKQTYAKGEKLEMPFPKGFYDKIPENTEEIWLLDGCVIVQTAHGQEREINAIALVPYKPLQKPQNQDIPGFTGDMEYPLQK